jgi:hypothetical protein
VIAGLSLSATDFDSSQWLTRSHSPLLHIRQKVSSSSSSSNLHMDQI